MLKFICESKDRRALIEKIVSEFGKRSLNRNGVIGSGFGVTECEDGLYIDGMKYCTIVKDGSIFRMQDNGGYAVSDALKEVKKAFPDIEIKGSLTMGDDNYRRNYWYYSAPDSTEVEEDYAYVERESDIGIPIYKC